jgi:hypothetical protein
MVLQLPRRMTDAEAPPPESKEDAEVKPEGGLVQNIDNDYGASAAAKMSIARLSGRFSSLVHTVWLKHSTYWADLPSSELEHWNQMSSVLFRQSLMVTASRHLEKMPAEITFTYVL